MPGIDKRVHFFEEASQKRDTVSWWEHLESKVLNWGLQVAGLTSDRARSLVKLGKEQYLNVASMPDLFHFAQDISKAVGCRIGLKKGHLQKKRDKCSDAVQKAKLEAELAQVLASQQDYREQIEQVNKTVHPFDSTDIWRRLLAWQPLFNDPLLRLKGAMVTWRLSTMPTKVFLNNAWRR